MSAKDRFIQEELRNTRERVLTDQTAAIQKNTTERTGTLLNSRRITVQDGQINFEHPIYERFLDIKRLSASGGRGKSRRIHNRFMWGAYQRLSERLMVGFSDEVRSMMRNIGGKSNGKA